MIWCVNTEVKHAFILPDSEVQEAVSNGYGIIGACLTGSVDDFDRAAELAGLKDYKEYHVNILEPEEGKKHMNSKAELLPHIGEAIAQISGTIADLANWFEGKPHHQYGKESFQPGKFKLPNGEIINIVFKKHEDMKRWIGTPITILSKAGGTKGLTGVKVDQYNDDVQLVITATATFVNGPAQSPTPPPVAPSRPAAQTPAPAHNAPQTQPPVQGDPLAKAKVFVARNLTLSKIVLRAVRALNDEYNTVNGIPMSNEMQIEVFRALHFGAAQQGITLSLPLNLDLATGKAVVAAQPPAPVVPPPPPTPPTPPPAPPAQPPEEDNIPF